VVLLADVDFVTQVTVAVIAAIGGALAAGIPVWLRYRLERRQHQVDMAAAREREQHVENEINELRRSMARLLEPIPMEGQVDINQIIPYVRQLADTANQLRQEVAELKQRLSAMAPIADKVQGLRQQVADLQQRAKVPQQKPAQQGSRQASTVSQYFGCREDTIRTRFCRHIRHIHKTSKAIARVVGVNWTGDGWLDGLVLDNKLVKTAAGYAIPPSVPMPSDSEPCSCFSCTGEGSR
jgi:hypothetical protein